jgi:hypothetical protein
MINGDGLRADVGKARWWSKVVLLRATTKRRNLCDEAKRVRSPTVSEGCLGDTPLFQWA